ncbi:MAG: hypothetical protein ACI9WU_003755 [Myxococcota bacterium]
MSPPVLAGAALASIAFVIVAFRSRKSRLIALATLVPLLALAAVIQLAGERVRDEADDLQTEATLFGDGSHEQGASHAGGAAVEAAPSAHGSPAASTLDQWLAAPLALEGLTWPDRGKPYTARTLWNRIDGGAELYRELGLKAALFATARIDDADIEVQLYDMGTTANAGKLWARVADDVPETAILWEGGGELRKESLYARIVLSSASDAAPVLAAPRRILEALGGSFSKAEPEAKAPPEVPAPAPDTTPKTALPTQIHGVAEAAEQKNWGGRDYLGTALVGEAPDESEVWITAPPDVASAMGRLRESFAEVTQDGDVFSASDAYVGDVVFTSEGPWVVGVAGFEDRKTAVSLLQALLADLLGPN